MKKVCIVGIGQIPVKKIYQPSLRKLAAEACRLSLENAGGASVGALYVGNMLSDELQQQKHLGALIADEAGLSGVEAFQVRAATAAGAAALRVGFLAVKSGAVDTALVVGIEKMGNGMATPALAKALDSKREVSDGATLISQNARLMRLYFDTYNPPPDALAHFSVNSHDNARNNPNALFRDRAYSTKDILSSRIISPPIRLLDCSPVCDGAAAVLLAPQERAYEFTDQPVQILSSSVATDRFRMEDRSNPLALAAVQASAEQALKSAGIRRSELSFFELHDAFSIMSCLALEATGFASNGEGWRMAAEGEIRLDGRVPISTMGGLKARGHPIGATALYQVCEIVLQLTDSAGPNQIPNARTALMQSIGGVASTVISHVFSI